MVLVLLLAYSDTSVTVLLVLVNHVTIPVELVTELMTPIVILVKFLFT
jgi:hypothetical protein